MMDAEVGLVACAEGFCGADVHNVKYTSKSYAYMKYYRHIKIR